MSAQWTHLCTILLILLHVHSQEEFEWKEGKNGMIFSTGCEYSGFDWYSRPSNPAECLEKCYKDSYCTHFTWKNLTELGGTCELKRNVDVGTRPVKVADKSVMCGQRGAGKNLDWHSVDDGQLLWALGCDFELKTMTLLNLSPPECFLECQQQPECTHFSWNWTKNGTCLMKQQLTTDSEVVMKNHKFICGYKPQEKFEFDVNHNLISSSCDFEGNILMNEITKTAHACSRLCMKNTACTHFSYTDKDGGRCFLKNDVSDRARPKHSSSFTQCGFKYISPDETSSNCYVFKEERNNFCNIDLQIVLNRT